MSAVAVLRVANTFVAAGVRMNGDVEWLHQEGHQDHPSLVLAVEEVLNGEELRRVRSVEVCLDASVVQLRTLRDLPPLSAADLVELVSNQVERFFRIPEGGGVVAAHWVRDGGGPASARTALADRGLVEAVEETVIASDRRVVEVYCEDGERSEPLRFQTIRTRRRRAAERRRMLVMSALVVCIGWAVAGGTYLTDLRRDRRALETELATLQDPLARLASVEELLGEFRPVAEAFERQGPDGAWLAAHLARIVRALPDSAYLIGLTTERGGQTALQVRAKDALEVVDALRRSGPSTAGLQAPPEEIEVDGRTLEQFTVILGPVR